MEIKHKAKRLDNGEWVFGYYSKWMAPDKDWTGKVCGKPTPTHVIYKCEFTYNQEWHTIDPSTVCVYTGIKDSEGNEIYEGDKLLVTHIEWDCADIYTVIYGIDSGYPAFELDRADGIPLECNGLQLVITDGDYCVKVIGNIHDKDGE